MSPAGFLGFAGLIIIAAYIVFRVIVLADYQRSGRTSWLSSALELILCILYMAFPYAYLPVDWYLLPERDLPSACRFISVAMILISVLLTLYSMLIVLGFQRAMGWPSDILIETGPYKLSRNPQIVSFVLVVIGFIVYWPRWHQLGWILLFAIVFHLMVLTEEEHLLNQFGDYYRSYCRRVPRYVW